MIFRSPAGERAVHDRYRDLLESWPEPGTDAYALWLDDALEALDIH